VSAPEALPRITDQSLGQFLEAEYAALILAKSTCGRCAAYEQEILKLQHKGALEGVAMGKLVLDAPGALRFKKENPWLSCLQALPYTLLFLRRELVDHFAASRGVYLRERVETRLPGVPG
jgi:hypothetical protein